MLRVIIPRCFVILAAEFLRTGAVFVALLIVLLLPRTGWSLEPCQWWEPVDCWNRKSVAQLWVDAGAAKEDFTAQIAAARAKFWATYPNKPGFQQAAANFAALLNDKDLYYLNTFVSVERLNRPASLDAISPENAMDIVSGGVKVDGGIRDQARPAMQAWSRSFKEHLDAAGGLFSPNVVQNVVTAMQQSEAQHRRYLVARDWAEFDAAGRIPVGFDVPDKYASLLYARFGSMTIEEAEQNVRTLRRLYGDALVLRAAGEVLHAPKTARGNLVDHAPDVPALRDQYGARVPDLSVPQPPQVIGIYSNQLDAFELIAARTDDRKYALKLLADAKPYRPAQSRYIGKWDFAERAYGHFVDAYGESAVMQAARAVRTATKQLYDGAVMHPDAIGARRHDPYRAFQDVLAGKDQAGAVRLILAFDPGYNSRQELNGAYAKLVAQYTEAKIFAAMQKLAPTDPDPLYGEFNLLTSALGGGKPCDTGGGVPRGGKGAAIGRAAGGQGSDCTQVAAATGAPRTYQPESETAPAQQPTAPNSEWPHYELSQTRASASVSAYCTAIYNPPQPLLTQQQIQTYYANPSAVEAEVKRCAAWFKPEQVMQNRKLAMRYCITHHDFSRDRTPGQREQYNTCMSEHDTLSALCSIQMRYHRELNGRKGFATSSTETACPADTPGDSREYYAVRFGNSEDRGNVKIPETAPDLPSALKTPFPIGILFAGVPAPAATTQSADAGSHLRREQGDGRRADPPPAPASRTQPQQAKTRGRLPFGLPGISLPGSSAQSGSTQALVARFRTDSNRASQVRRALLHMPNAELPNGVAGAKDRLDGELKDASLALVNGQAADPALTKLEGTLAELEGFVGSRR
jgi:hypothetical protein